ncbi:MAG TPA: hypothetical protein VMX97_03765, partial [Hyphomicrobiaceae bacterium]|nr:hypothetical protein [Hyphomicrobiaceae bacterium]
EVLGGGGASQIKDSRLARLVESGRLGKKSGEGFYVWKDGRAQGAGSDEPAAALDALGRDLVKPLIDECEKCLAEQVVASADLVDAGVIFGTGFAPFRGGPLHYRARLGATTETSHAAAAE